MIKSSAALKAAGRQSATWQPQCIQQPSRLSSKASPCYINIDGDQEGE